MIWEFIHVNGYAVDFSIESVIIISTFKVHVLTNNGQIKRGVGFKRNSYINGVG